MNHSYWDLNHEKPWGESGMIFFSDLDGFKPSEILFNQQQGLIINNFIGFGWFQPTKSLGAKHRWNVILWNHQTVSLTKKRPFEPNHGRLFWTLNFSRHIKKTSLKKTTPILKVLFLFIKDRDFQGICVSRIFEIYTLPKTNIAPVRRPSQKETHLPPPVFQVRAVSFREGI